MKMEIVLDVQKDVYVIRTVASAVKTILIDIIIVVVFIL
jgi:hypothetical protein